MKYTIHEYWMLSKWSRKWMSFKSLRLETSDAMTIDQWHQFSKLHILEKIVFWFVATAARSLGSKKKKIISLKCKKLFDQQAIVVRTKLLILEHFRNENEATETFKHGAY